MRTLRAFAYALVLAPLSLAAACQDGTSPPPAPTSFDARQALAAMDPLAAPLDQGIFDSFHGALVYFRAAIASGTAAPLRVTVRPAGLPAGQVLLAAAPLAVSDIPPALEGKTLVYDVAANRYVPDPAAVGAPEAGVRLVLYAWDKNLGRLVFPIARVGYADVTPIDTGSPSADLVEFIIVRDEPHAVVSDFAVSHGSDASGDRLGVDGTVSDGTTTVNITVDITESGPANQIQTAFSSTLSVQSLGISSHFQFTSVPGELATDGRLELRYDGHTLTQQGMPGGAEFRFDGDVYARVVAAEGTEPQFSKPDGTPLSNTEITDLTTLLLRVLLAHFFSINLASS